MSDATTYAGRATPPSTSRSGLTPLGGMQIDRIARSAAGYEARNFASYDEAEAFLDSLID